MCLLVKKSLIKFALFCFGSIIRYKILFINGFKMAKETPEYHEATGSKEKQASTKNESLWYVPKNKKSLRYDLAHQIEQEDAEVDLIYKGVLLDLHEKFPAIPEKLEGNKTIILRYINVNWIYYGMEVHDNFVRLRLYWEKNLYIRKEWEWKLWRVGLEEEWGEIIKESFSFLKEFEQGVNDIINNADDYKIAETYYWEPWKIPSNSWTPINFSSSWPTRTP